MGEPNDCAAPIPPKTRGRPPKSSLQDIGPKNNNANVSVSVSDVITKKFNGNTSAPDTVKDNGSINGFANDDMDFANKLLTALKTPAIVDALCTVLTPRIQQIYNDRISNLENELIVMQEQLRSFEERTKKVDELELELNSISAKLVQSNQAPPRLQVDRLAPSIPQTATQSVTLVDVHREMEEKRRRAANVVVHGLAPDEGIEDADLVSKFMEENLSLKPSFDRNKCRRLGKRTDGKTQPLLVVFNSSIAAADVLASAKELKDITPRVYLNPDMTKAEAQKAYEEREKRRQRKSQTNTAPKKLYSSSTGSQSTATSVNSNCPLNVEASPFVSTGAPARV